jgi:hypothetical protein
MIGGISVTELILTQKWPTQVELWLKQLKATREQN